MVSIPCMDPLGMGKVRRWFNQSSHVFEKFPDIGDAFLICELQRYKVGAEPIVINGPQLPIDKATYIGFITPLRTGAHGYFKQISAETWHFFGWQISILSDPKLIQIV